VATSSRSSFGLGRGGYRLATPLPDAAAGSWRRSRRLLQLRHQRPIDISERKTRRRQLTWQNGPNAGVGEVQDAVDVGTLAADVMRRTRTRASIDSDVW